MLSPDGFGEKARQAPSIWSFDSGYGSQSVHEEEGRNGAFYLQASTSSNSLQGRLDSTENLGLGLHLPCFQPIKEEPAIDPLVTKLSVFTTKETPIFNNDLYLPEISSEGETCLTCEFWRITNPGEDVRCEDCRVPEIIEPSLLLVNGSRGKESLRPLDIPEDKRPAQTRCSACELSGLIDPSGPSSCSSCAPSLGFLSPVSPPTSEGKVRRSRAGRNSKLPLSALNRLQAWLEANQDDPYPTAEVKKQLAQECGITEKQVTTWFTNARARQLSPLDTYLASGSEDEGAKENDIASAAETSGYNTGFTFLSSNTPPTGARRAASVSGSSAISTGQNRPQRSRRGKKKDYRRNNTLSPQTIGPAFHIHSPQIMETPPFQIHPPPNALDENPEDGQVTWQCTFCRRHLAPKSWRRHEETQHRPRAQWTCMLYGPRLSYPNRSGSSCAFCMAKDPSEEHFLKNHRINECAKRPINERTFLRPDHLRQHVKNFHSATLFNVVQARWKRGADEKDVDGWICGFCNEKLETWGGRETHIGNHFKEGMTMADWRDHAPPKEKKDKKKCGKEKEKKEEKEHAHGLARLSRTFTRRSTRNSSKPSSSHGQQHPQPPTTFANVFDSIPMSVDPITQYSAPPVLPDINMDPLMGGGYTTYVDWTQVSEPQSQFTENLAFDPTGFDHTLNNMLQFGNAVDYHWDPPS